MARRSFISVLAYAASIIAAVVSCSPASQLSDGQYWLAKNEIKVDGDISSSKISPYIKQQPTSYFIFDFNPFKPPVVYSAALVEASKENIKNHLHYLGYYSPKVEAYPVFRKRKAVVSYVVTPGTQTVISDITYNLPGGDDFNEDFENAAAASQVQPGAPLSEDILEAETTRATSSMRMLGYYGLTKGNFSFIADTLGTPGTARLEYKVDSPSPIVKYTFGSVTFAVPSSLPFRKNVLKRFNTIKPGTTYSEKIVNETYNRLSSIRAFNGVNIETSDNGSNQVDTRISVSAAKVQGFKVNLEGSFTSTGLLGISPQVSFYHKNIFHGGEWLNLGFAGDFQVKPGTDTKSTELRVDAGLSFPMPLYRMDVKAAFDYQNRPEFTRQIVSGSFGFSGKLWNRLRFQVNPIQVNTVKILNISDSFRNTLDHNLFLNHSFSDHFDAGIGGTIYYNTSTELVPKTSFHYYRLSFESSGNLFGLFHNILPENEHGQKILFSLPYSQFVKAELTFSRTWKFGEDSRHSFATRIVGGAAYAYDNSLYVPFEKQFYVGGASSMRGWQARSIGPGFDEFASYFVIPSQTGDLKFELDAEYRFRMFWKVEGALFAEVGNVWNMKELDYPFYKSLAGDWGAGVRVNLDFIVLRLDMGLKVHDPSRAEGHRWLSAAQWFENDGFSVHFGVGYPF